ncbi:MAG TPA: hypothetical protein VGJ07_13810 [Rugosimonospora sp.]
MGSIDIANVRHPLDPDPVPSTKALAVLALGIVAAVTGFFIGGIIPATIALLLARDARREMSAARGFLSGGRRIRIGVALAWVGIVLAACAVVVAAIVGLLHAAGSGSANYAPNVN